MDADSETVNRLFKEEEKLKELEQLQMDRDDRMAREFRDEYQRLVNKYGFHLAAFPEFAQSHSGSFELYISLRVLKVNHNAR